MLKVTSFKKCFSGGYLPCTSIFIWELFEVEHLSESGIVGTVALVKNHENMFFFVCGYGIDCSMNVL